MKLSRFEKNEDILFIRIESKIRRYFMNVILALVRIQAMHDHGIIKLEC